jgi:hypothetical protein
MPTISGGVTFGVVTLLALLGFGWLVFHMVKKDKLRISHVIAVTLTCLVFQLSPLGQLAFRALFTALNGLSSVAV